jgi:hypothetical protein
MNPLKVIIVKPEDPNAFSEGVQVVGAIAWMIGAWIIWSSFNLFDSTAGKACFLPALAIAAVIGFHTTLFLISASILFTIFGLVVGWIFDFAFFEATFKYIGITLDFLAKLGTSL